MVQYIEGRLLDSKVNFIINLVNTDNLPNFDLTKDIYKKFPHVEIETNKYLRHCKKKCKSTIGTMQYIPTEYWALSLCNTMDNQKFEPYMSDCQYVVNVFCYEQKLLNEKAYKNAMIHILKVASTHNFVVGLNKKNEYINIIQDVLSSNSFDANIKVYME